MPGFRQKSLQTLGLPALPTTDGLTKEDFNALIPLAFDSRIDFMFEILKSFSPTTAALHNRSFKFFFDRYHLEDPAVFPLLLLIAGTAGYYRNHYCNSPRYCCNNQYFRGFYLMTKYVCMICGHEYNPEKGEPNRKIAPGTPFPALPADWVCPVCGAEKRLFKEVQE